MIALKGAMFYNAEFSAPWSFRSRSTELIAPYLGSEGGHVIIYHLLMEGAAWAELDGGQRVELGPGDIVIFPHGDAHLMGNGPTAQPINDGQDVAQILSNGLSVVRMGGGGAATKFVCGYMTCDREVSRLVLGGLPPLLKVNIRNDPSGVWLENSILFSVANASSSVAGAEAVLAKLSEALFIETLRRYVTLSGASQTGWLAGALDPNVGKALALLHAQPSRRWTIEMLATSVGVSRSVLAERFRHFLGEPPIAYLTRWRLQLSTRLLTGSKQSIAEVAAKVGYESEAAFNRAFKRAFEVPPARFRREAGVSNRS